MKKFIACIVTTGIFYSSILLGADYYFQAVSEETVAVSQSNVAAAIQSEPHLYGIGEEVQVGLHRITVHSLVPLTKTQEVIKPKNGNQIYVLEATIFNGSTQYLVPGTLVDNKLYIDNQYYGIKPYYPDVADIFTLDIAPGQTKTGKLVVELPKDSKQAFLLYTSDKWNEDVIIHLTVAE